MNRFPNPFYLNELSKHSVCKTVQIFALEDLHSNVTSLMKILQP